MDAMIDAGIKPVEIARALRVTEALVLKQREKRGHVRRIEKQREARASSAIRRVARMGDDESFVVAMLHIAVEAGYLAEKIECQKIVSARFEYPVGCGRIDLAVESLGGHYSLIEAKKIDSIREVATAIGQLHVYEVLFREKLSSHGIEPLTVRRWLACQTLSDPLRDTVLRACASAGVAVMFVGEFGVVSEQAIRAIRGL